MYRSLRRSSALGLTMALMAALMVPMHAAAGLDHSARAQDLTTVAPAACLKSLTRTGVNAYGYGRTSSLNDWAKYVRTAPKATLCINYAAAYGGYYFSALTCGDSSARLVEKSLSVTRRTNGGSRTRTSANCRSDIDWKWDRTWPVADQCASLASTATWRLNQSDGTVTLASKAGFDDWFLPVC